ncbi:MAG TPA: hypothetical protein VGI03_16410 [Verrucomicrobiae bacterium]|jgi:hypothetical protein
MEIIETRLQKFQGRFDNTGWRIPLVTYDGPKKNWPVLVGAIVFLIGFVLCFHTRQPVYLFVALPGFAFGMIGSLIFAKLKRRGWVKMPAVCVDREIRTIHVPDGVTWSFRLLCRFALDGKDYSVTPYFWKGFISENAINKFLAAKIRDDGNCFLYVNPKNPLQADFAAEDVADKFLH